MTIIKQRKDGVVQRYHAKPKFRLATVRVMAVDDENDDDYSDAMEFEFTDAQSKRAEEILARAEKDGTLKDSQYIGNAYSLEATESVINQVYNALKQDTKLPAKMKMGIEWDYWIDDDGDDE